MKNILFILLILLFIPIVSSEELLHYNNIEMIIEQKGSILTSNVDELKLYFYVYPKGEYSEVSSIVTKPDSILENESYIFSWSSVNGNLDYSVNSKVKNIIKIKKIKNKINFPIKVPDQYRNYTKSSELCDSDNIKIKKLANSLASGEDDAYKVIFKLTNWVKSNLNYSLDYKKDTLKSSEVLGIRKGACDEFSNLLLAMLRSLNIPSRYVTGYTYGTYGEHKFDSHGWVEAWLPEYGWIPIDPTYGELGWLDSTHVKLADNINPKPSSVDYKWTGGEVEGGTLDQEIEVISKEGNIPVYLEGELTIEDNKVDFGSYNILWLNIKNPNDYYISTYATLKVAPSLIGKNGKMVFLEPNSEERVGWIVKYPSNLSEGYIYTFLNNATAYFLGNRFTASVVSEGENYLLLEECEALVNKKEVTLGGSPDISIKIIKPTEVKLGEIYNINVELENQGSAPVGNLTVCIKQDCRNNYAGIGQTINEKFELVASNLGKEKVIVTFKNVAVEPQVFEINVIEKSILEKIIDFFKNLFKLK